MQQTFTILPATTDNMESIIALARRIWPIAYVSILTPAQIENMLTLIYSPENLQQEMADGHRFWLVYQDKNPIAYASAYKENNIIWIKKLYVDPSAKGQGIGSALIEQAIVHFLPAKDIRLLVNPNNVAAHRFYERIGFSKIGEKHVHMGDWNFNDFIYSKSIIIGNT